VRASIGGTRLSFCCYGCVLAWQITRARGEEGAAAALLVRLGLAVFFAMNVMMVTLPTYAPHVYGAEAAADGPLFHALRVLALALALPVLLLLGWPILRTAAGARGAGLATDVLIVIGTGAAYGLSAWHTWSGRGPVYYDTAAMLLVLVTLGRYLEARARADATASVRRALDPAPPQATRVRGQVYERVAPERLRAGDVVRVAAAAAFPTDGIVLEGSGGVDEAALTGEHRPVHKRPGSRVSGGTCSVDGRFLVRVTAPAAESAAARIAALLDEARRQRSSAERLADRTAAAFVPLVIAAALAAGLWWTRTSGVDAGVLTALAVLVVACPCALGIATPLAAWFGLAAAVRHGVVARSAAALERAAAVTQVLFDKTGTLTTSTPALDDIAPAPGVDIPAPDLLTAAAALEEDLRHPLAQALRDAAQAAGRPAPCVERVRVVPGGGVRGLVDGRPLAVGSPQLAASELPAGAVGAADPARAVVCLWQPGRLLATFTFSETARRDAAPAVAALRRLGVGIGLLSGDHSAGAVVPDPIAPGEAVLALSPAGKIAAVRAARARGAVAMVGDGLNDAPALAAADVGIAVCAATDLARLTADIVILGDDLQRVPWLVEHARRVVRVMRQNLAWAFGYNLVAVAAAGAGLLTPIIASLAMLASSAAVLLNARRIGRQPD
jgi:Cu2+-exporting ATPase